jgi:hypothetical protein
MTTTTREGAECCLAAARERSDKFHRAGAPVRLRKWSHTGKWVTSRVSQVLTTQNFVEKPKTEKTTT